MRHYTAIVFLIKPSYTSFSSIGDFWLNQLLLYYRNGCKMVVFNPLPFPSTFIGCWCTVRESFLFSLLIDISVNSDSYFILGKFYSIVLMFKLPCFWPLVVPHLCLLSLLDPTLVGFDSFPAQKYKGMFQIHLVCFLPHFQYQGSGNLVTFK